MRVCHGFDEVTTLFRCKLFAAVGGGGGNDALPRVQLAMLRLARRHVRSLETSSLEVLLDSTAMWSVPNATPEYADIELRAEGWEASGDKTG